jgi:hypothetical protein
MRFIIFLFVVACFGMIYGVTILKIKGVWKFAVVYIIV